jgi:glycosyltransferase involved in cell wall biosynthesis
VYPALRPLNVLVWHVHSAWLGAFVRGGHRYLLPVRASGGSGCRRPEWPASVVDLLPQDASSTEIDVVVFQNLRELDEARLWLGRRRVPAIYVEHNAPQGAVNAMRHPLADRDDLVLVHVTHFNALMWDGGRTRACVIEHGVPDPGYRYEGSLPRIACAINEAKRRGRVTGTDLLPRFERVAPVDLFGIGGTYDVHQRDLHAEMPRRRLYVHPFRWTSLGLTLLEAMMLGMPVIALATTEAPRAVPATAGVCSSDLRVALDATRWLIEEPEAARTLGRGARAAALAQYGLERFHQRWDALFAESITSGRVCRASAVQARTSST